MEDLLAGRIGSSGGSAMPPSRRSASATCASFAAELRLVGEVLEAAAAARGVVRARRVDAVRPGREDFGGERLGVAALDLRHARADRVARKAAPDEDDEAVQTRDTVAAVGERLDVSSSSWPFVTGAAMEPA